VILIVTGQSIAKQVDIPFLLDGVYDVTVEATSDDGTLATTDIIVDVSWLDVYLYPLIMAGVAIVLISAIYVIRAMRVSKSFVTGAK
jgi:hypothetical protein